MRLVPIFLGVLEYTHAFSLSFMNPRHPHGVTAVGQNWAVLVVGSDGWFNYRHQVCVAWPG